MAIDLFLGTSTSVDKRNLQPFRASSELNARHEDGRLASRWGYKNLRSAQSGFTNTYGLVYLQGFNSSNAETEEYISFEHLGSDVRAYSRNATTLAPTAITGATNLHASDWAGFAFDDLSYLINPNHTVPVYRHTLGDTTSWTALTPPTGPTSAPGYSITYGGANTPYSTLSFTGLNPADAGEVAYTGSATATNSSVETDGSFIVGHLANSTLESSVSFDLNDGDAGIQNFTNNDKFAFNLAPLTSFFDIVESSIRFEFINNDGSPLTLIPNDLRVANVSGSYTVYGHFAEKTRADFDNVRYLKIYYKVKTSSGTASNNRLRVSLPIIGGIEYRDQTGGNPTILGVQVAYSHYNSGTGFESGLSPLLFIPPSVLEGQKPSGAFPFPGLGVHLRFSGFANSSEADNNRIYVLTRNDASTGTAWRRVVTQADGTSTYDYRLTYVEALALTAYKPAPFTYTNVTNAFVFKEWVVWLYKTGSSNVRHSAVGEPERQYTALDDVDDQTRGANFTLAEGYSDIPLGGVQVGNSAVIFGSNGVYEQVDTGGYPAAMSPSKRLGTSFGCAGKFAFCRFRDDNGNIGAAFVDRHGSGVHFIYPSGSENREIDGRVIELTRDIRGKLRSFLVDEQSADISKIQVFTDDAQDALWVVLGQRAMVLRRPSVVTGEREWEFYRYNTGSESGTFYRVAPSTKRRLRVIRSTGQVDELEWNSADSTFIGGIKRDGGNFMPTGHWRSKAFNGPNRRILRLYLERERVHEPASVKVLSSRKKQKYQIPAGKRYALCLPEQQGMDHEFEIEIPEMEGCYIRLSWDDTKLAKRLDT